MRAQSKQKDTNDTQCLTCLPTQTNASSYRFLVPFNNSTHFVLQGDLHPGAHQGLPSATEL